jgi:hypothetical protein
LLTLSVPVASCGEDEEPEPVVEFASCEDWIKPIVGSCCETNRDLIICDPAAVAELGPDDGRVIEYNAFFSGFSIDCRAVSQRCSSGGQVACEGQVVGGRCRYQCRAPCE